ncbi:MAG: tetratricopeptide repeat protein [Zymomonas mobilis]|uniref:tetratricopeptide repeat protein n=1 Tax=Zymomonas mobilis TaxID=542 RepID=UPI0001B70523|nr:tetratricopeptide repeat protein [Zymomonas mobilis]ACV75065.1 Tetratricopeptide domain protein [Zymomonas mobilis subsp. mobilis NCIMB 11163]
MILSLFALLAATDQMAPPAANSAPVEAASEIPSLSLPKSPVFLATGPRESTPKLTNAPKETTTSAPSGAAKNVKKNSRDRKKEKQDNETLKVIVPNASLKQRYDQCVNMIDRDPEQAAEIANTWRLSAGGVLANQCLGMAYVALGRYSAGVDSFEQAARESDLEHDGRSAIFWSQAGNAALANQDPGAARNAFDHALMSPVMPDKMRGNTLSDRARADVAVGDYAIARQDIDKALKLIPKDATAWLMSATLARHQGDLTRAKNDITEAEKFAPLDTHVSFEKGLIYALSGDKETAKSAWERTIRANPSAEIAEVARKALSEIDDMPANAATEPKSTAPKAP